jgi:HAD superfamily hydrolase (TIGR01509 family)
MDGVIVHSTPTHTEAWKRYLHSLGKEIPKLEQRMLGRHNDEIVRDFFAPEPLTTEAVFAHGARKEALYREIMAPELERHIIPGVREFLNRHSSIPTGVATNAERANVEFVLDQADLRRYFRIIVDGHEIKRPKPFPDIYLRAAELLNTDPSACVVFEDSFTGVEAARSAGMRVVGLATTVELLPGVDLMIKNFQDPKLELWLQTARSSA